MITMIKKKQTIYEISFQLIWENVIKDYLVTNYQIPISNENIRIRVINEKGAMVDPNVLQIKMPENLSESELIV